MKDFRLLPLAALLLCSLPASADRSLNRPGWSLAWHDEFDGTSVDPSKWNIDDQPAPANSELEWYSRDNVSVQNGKLILKSEPRQINGFNYASGKVTTAGKFDKKFGRIEIRAKLPGGKGIWPAHWMLPYNHWPPEIDITEMIGSVPNRITMSVHWGPLPPGTYPWDIGQTRNTDFWGPDFTQDFHIFALEWYDGWLSWEIDGVQRHSSWEGIPQENMFLILNTAIGGTWPGSPDGSTQWPQYHEIDYVRVYDRIYTSYPLLNAGFEDDVGDSFPNWNRWDSGNVVREPVRTYARTGSGAVKLYGRFNGSDNVSGIYQSIPAAAGERWKARTWARNRPGDALTGGNEGRMKLEFVDAGGTVLASNASPIVNASSPEPYALHEKEASAPPGTAWVRLTLELFQTGDAPGAMNVDDTSLVRVDPQPGVLANADFEQWNGDTFVLWNHYDTNNIAQDAQAANALSGTGAVHAWGRFDTADNRSGIYQDLPTAAGQWWEAAVFARNRPGDPAQGNNTASLKLEFVDGNGAVLSTTSRTVIDATSPEIYAPFLVRAQAPVGSANARIVLEYRQLDFANGSVIFDNASLRTVSAYRAWIAGFFDPDSPAAAPLIDSDHDGQSNNAEFYARTNPADPTSILRITSFSRNPASGDFTLTWNAVEGVAYRIVATPDLQKWNPADPAVKVVGGPFTGHPSGPLSHTMTLPPGSRFLRVEVD